MARAFIRAHQARWWRRRIGGNIAAGVAAARLAALRRLSRRGGESWRRPPALPAAATKWTTRPAALPLHKPAPSSILGRALGRITRPSLAVEVAERPAGGWGLPAGRQTGRSARASLLCLLSLPCLSLHCHKSDPLAFAGAWGGVLDSAAAVIASDGIRSRCCNREAGGEISCGPARRGIPRHGLAAAGKRLFKKFYRKFIDLQEATNCI